MKKAADSWLGALTQKKSIFKFNKQDTKVMRKIINEGTKMRSMAIYF